MKTKLDLPDGARPGSILEVTYPLSDAGTIPGTFEGRLLGVKGQRITVHFTYAQYDDPSEETLVINLETGMDEKYHTPVTAIALKVPVRGVREEE